MTRVLTIAAAALAAAIGMTLAMDASAGERTRKPTQQGPVLTEHPKSTYYRSRRAGPQVRGYAARRGGYSYTYNDSINTYGDSRSLYGSTQLFRHPSVDRQSTAGPFDHGFFFDSGVQPRGGDSPYMH